jgi:hypothetical protein
MRYMGRKRFALLAGVLVTLNLVLWIAPQGLALRDVVISKLFGPKLIRAEVIDRAPGGTTTDWRIDRGVIVAVAPDQLVLREADGTVQNLTLGTATPVTFRGRALALTALAPGWHVLVTWPAPDGPVDTVKVEKRGKLKLKPSKPSSSSRAPAAFHLS